MRPVTEDPDRVTELIWDADGESAYELDDAARRLAWRNSPERRQTYRRALAVSIPVTALGAALGGYFWVESNYHKYGQDGVAHLWIAGGCLGAAITVAMCTYGTFYYRLLQRRGFRDRYTIDLARGRLTEAEQVVAAASQDTSFTALWIATQSRLDYYHQIATGQSQRSFTYGQVAAGTGLVVVLACTVLAIVADSAAGAVAAGVLGGASAAMSGYIGSTFLRTQDLAAAQLRAYFGQPLEFSRYLSAERLLSEINDPARREDATVALIQAIAGQVRPDTHAAQEAGG